MRSWDSLCFPCQFLCTLPFHHLNILLPSRQRDFDFVAFEAYNYYLLTWLAASLASPPNQAGIQAARSCQPRGAALEPPSNPALATMSFLLAEVLAGKHFVETRNCIAYYLLIDWVIDYWERHLPEFCEDRGLLEKATLFSYILPLLVA